MPLPLRLTAVLGRHPDEICEDDLQTAVDHQVPESEDLDWKKDFYAGTDAGKKELAKDVSAMANTRGGLIVIGVDDGKQDQAVRLAPQEPAPGRGEEWMRLVLASYAHPPVPNVAIRRVPSQQEPGRSYWVIAVEKSPQAPHAVAPSGNDFHPRYCVRHGTTTRTLTESEIAQRYRDRMQAAVDDMERLADLHQNGITRLGTHVSSTASDPSNIAIRFGPPVWLGLTSVPTVRGHYPLVTQAARTQALRRFLDITGEGQMFLVQPRGAALVGRRQVRFEGNPTGQLHEDGSLYCAVEIELKSSISDPAHDLKTLDQREVEVALLDLTRAAAAWAAESGAGGDLMLRAQLHRYGGRNRPFRMRNEDFASAIEGPVATVPQEAADTVAQLAALVTSELEAVSAAYTLAADLLADMGVGEPRILTAHGAMNTQALADHSGVFITQRGPAS